MLSSRGIHTNNAKTKLGIVKTAISLYSTRFIYVMNAMMYRPVANVIPDYVDGVLKNLKLNVTQQIVHVSYFGATTFVGNAGIKCDQRVAIRFAESKSI